MPSSSSSTTCPFCHQSQPVVKSSIISPINSVRYDLNYCRRCELEFFTPLVFEDIYSDDSQEWYREFHEWRTYYPEWTKKIVRYIQKSNMKIRGCRILEVWAGDGINFEALKSVFWAQWDDYTAIELDTKSIQICHKRGIKHVINKYFNNKIIEVLNGQFDIIIITEVLEHQIDPREFLETVLKIIEPSGIVFITVPNRDRFFINKRSQWDVAPHHFLRFNKQFFKKNFGTMLQLVEDYEFKNKNLIDSAKVLSCQLLGGKIPWMIFVIPVIFLRILDMIEWEGIFVVMRPNLSQKTRISSDTHS